MSPSSGNGSETPSKWATTKQNRFPCLANLQIDFGLLESPNSLYLLDIFKQSPVNQLEILDVGYSDPAEFNTNRTTEMVMNILSHFEPDTVRIKSPCMKSVLVILDGLNRQHLRTVSLYITSANDTALGPFGFKTETPHMISLPLLSTLMLKVVTTAQVLDLFRQLDVDALVSLDLDINSAPDQESDADVAQESGFVGSWDPGPSSLPPVKVRGLTREERFRDVSLPTNWETHPNLKHFLMCSSIATLPVVCRLILSFLGPVQNLSSGIGVIPFPYLSHLDVKCQVALDSGLFTVTKDDVEVSRLVTVHDLVSRHQKGAVLLELTQFGYDVEKQELNFCAVKNKEGRAGGSTISSRR